MREERGGKEMSQLLSARVSFIKKTPIFLYLCLVAFAAVFHLPSTNAHSYMMKKKLNHWVDIGLSG